MYFAFIASRQVKVSARPLCKPYHNWIYLDETGQFLFFLLLHALVYDFNTLTYNFSSFLFSSLSKKIFLTLSATQHLPFPLATSLLLPLPSSHFLGGDGTHLYPNAQCPDLRAVNASPPQKGTRPVSLPPACGSLPAEQTAASLGALLAVQMWLQSLCGAQRARGQPCCFLCVCWHTEMPWLERKWMVSRECPTI